MGFKSVLLKYIYRFKCILKVFLSQVDLRIISQVMGCLAPALLPPLHIAITYYLWQEFSRKVDRRYCSCSCWDTVFKGTYETGIASYKHIYFNATVNTLKMWVFTVSFVILCYESVRRLVLLGFQNNLRYSMLILFISAIFSHYYTWWAYWNYWNDDFYSQWNHQFFFSSTELLSTFLVLQLADFKVPVTSRKALLIVGIAVLHIVTGGLDQFFQNVIQGEGYSHQVLRDVSFMIPDILHVFLPLCELKRTPQNGIFHINNTSVHLKRDLLITSSLVFCGLLLYSCL